ncbi:DUF4013 domain-containing protein [Methanoregula sp.]|jgi:hypothetical protein|uniref:DUF4013 domain-containing protein n=1 Tax=Methanoregula sp. TaxID=2052170 RepID=UPI003C1C43F9
MDYGAMITDSFEYAKEALVGKWGRWMIFILISLPFALINFVFDPQKIIDKTTKTFHWELVHWDQIAILIVAGLLLMIFFAGYEVRIYRGIKPAPEFDNWKKLFIDGLKMSIVTLLWFLPIIATILAGLGIIFFDTEIAKGSTGIVAVVSVITMILMILLAFVFLIVFFLYAVLGSIRFARTGSIREGIRFSKISEVIRTMGWLSYITALIVLVVLYAAFWIIRACLSIIPFVGWILIMIINPFFLILTDRYFTLVYEQGEIQQGAAVQ